MNLYVSDLHFGHSNVIRFDNRPFFDRDEMDRVLIKLWNNRVQPDDHVYVIGDFCYRSERSPDWYLKRLCGHKHLVVGNHDGEIMKSERALGYFESVEKMMHVEDGGEHLCLCHYPLAEWYGMQRGNWLVYGHIHGDTGDTYQFMKTREKALNAAACINGYTPVSLKELIRNNQEFKKRN